MKIFLNWQCFIFITITFVYYKIITPKIINSYWFMIIFFFFSMLNKISHIFEHSIFNYCISFFEFFFNGGIIYLFFQSKKISYIFKYVFFRKALSSHYYMLRKKLIFFFFLNILYSSISVLQFSWISAILRFHELCNLQ